MAVILWKSAKYQPVKEKSWNSWYVLVWKYQLDEENAKIVGT